MDYLKRIDQNKVKQAWKNFLSGEGSTSYIRPEILKAWNRCRQLGTNPYNKKPDQLTDPNEIKKKLEENKVLLSVSEPAIKYLYNFIAGSKLFVSVSDAKGCLLLVYCDEEMTPSAKELIYTDWSEEKLGNNPIATSIVEKRALFIRGYEHYCIYPHNYTGASSPIHDPRGNIIGAIAITGRSEIAHHHTLGMISMTAYSIERELKILEALQSIDIAYNHRNTILDSISEGILVINNEYNIIYVNHIFEEYFSTNKDFIINNDIFSFFNDPLIQDIIRRKTSLTDYVSEITVNNVTLPCTITYTPIKGRFVNDGVIVINKLSRAKKLANKIVETGASLSFNEIIGEDEYFKELIDTAKTFALTDSNILLLGENGTGKDVFAQAIHNYSNRKNGPFIPINCGAIPKELINSELFGYVKGAFTGASKDGSPGKFELANGGTIFLDEIGEMPLEMQTSLLRVIESKVICRIGGHEHTPINVRIIAATNKNLSVEAEANRFRQDLYYRLNVLSITLPPLRERKRDIKPLSLFFLNKLNIKYEKFINNIPDEIWRKFMNYNWPGNIRQLENTIERCVALSSDYSLSPDLLPSEIYDYNDHTESNLDDLSNIMETETTIKEYNDGELLEQALKRNKWNITKVAKEFKVSRATIYRKMKEFQL